MKVYFCTACNAGLILGRPRCRHCHTRAGSTAWPEAVRQRWLARLARLGAFFESQASLSLTTLLIFLGLGIALAPAGWNYAQVQPVASSAVTAGCLRVFFSEMATVGQIVELVGQLNAVIVLGPDRWGAFELSVPDQAMPAAAGSLGQAADTVEGVFLKPHCRG